MRAVVTCLALAATGCDVAFGVPVPQFDAARDGAGPDLSSTDLDEDTIPDDMDTCIAPASEALGDVDGDTLPNGMDPCPFDGDPANDDQDELPNDCDPFLDIPGDHSRCVMFFTDVALDAALWRPRPPHNAWTFSPGQLIGAPVGFDFTTTVAARSLEGRTTTTYDVAMSNVVSAGGGSFTLWVRAAPGGPSMDDVGCRVLDDQTATRLYVISQKGATGDANSTSRLPSSPATNRMVATVTTIGGSGAPAQVTCGIYGGGFALITNDSVPLGAGNVGFTADRWVTRISALHIMDHP